MSTDDLRRLFGKVHASGYHLPQLLEESAQKLGLERKHLTMPLEAESDATYVLQVATIVEGIVRALIRTCLQPTALGALVADNRSYDYRRKLDIADAAGLLTPELRSSLKAISELRNNLAHGPRQVLTFEFAEYFRASPEKKHDFDLVFNPFIEWMADTDKATLTFGIGQTVGKAAKNELTRLRDTGEAVPSEIPRLALMAVVTHFEMWAQLKWRESDYSPDLKKFLEMLGAKDESADK